MGQSLCSLYESVACKNNCQVAVTFAKLGGETPVVRTWNHAKASVMSHAQDRSCIVCKRIGVLLRRRIAHIGRIVVVWSHCGQLSCKTGEENGLLSLRTVVARIEFVEV